MSSAGLCQFKLKHLDKSLKAQSHQKVHSKIHPRIFAMVLGDEVTTRWAGWTAEAAELIANKLGSQEPASTSQSQ